ncbi:type I restriction-modification system subunit M [Megasphaera elsdenii]|uniref:type I restriction-modification system subunit M n=1 Tax=Megasphaera elsdenii TaxID=907 RepID=UPI0024306729|nr:class I SAM-dependent DNA methyltransferase [Megasphaera elsdenii]
MADEQNPNKTMPGAAPEEMSKIIDDANFIWSIADNIRNAYMPDKYGDVIIPMTIIRRFECSLAPTKQKVIDLVDKYGDVSDQELYSLTGYPFYNTSRFDLAELLNDADKLAENFKSYIQKFSPNVKEILFGTDAENGKGGLHVFDEIDKMNNEGCLFSVVNDFSNLDLSPATFDSVRMGYIFENLIGRFFQNVDAGQFYTGRDIIRMLVSVLTAEGCDDIFEDSKVITVLDQAAGTGGMLTTAYEHLHALNPSALIRLFGQELMPVSYAVGLAEMLIKEQNAENFVRCDTLKEDRFPNRKMRFCLENPPFGTPWGGKKAKSGQEKAVTDEHKKGFDGRWGAGLPGTGDAQLLFVQSAINKLDDNVGRAAIIENGSPLFTGGVSSGESQIRRWLLENDLLEAIIAMPTDMFYNTGIATYAWIISKNKRPERRRKIQLIDATNIFHPLRKSVGNKRREFTAEDRERIVRLYADFKENELSQIHRNTEFIYREYAVMQPLQRSYGITEERIQNLESKDRKNELASVITFLRNHETNEKYMSPDAFEPVITEILRPLSLTKKDIGFIMDGLSMMDKEAEIQKDKKGNILYDKETKDTEDVCIEEDINDYMQREVLPHVPDAKAFFEEDLSKKKPVIKTGAEIPFTRYFYKYQQPEPSDKVAELIEKLETEINQQMQELFKK